MAAVGKPFGGLIRKRIKQVKVNKVKRKKTETWKPGADASEAGDAVASETAIQPLKILIHKGVSSGKKITYAVTSVADQTP